LRDLAYHISHDVIHPIDLNVIACVKEKKKPHKRQKYLFLLLKLQL